MEHATEEVKEDNTIKYYEMKRKLQGHEQDKVMRLPRKDHFPLYSLMG